MERRVDELGRVVIPKHIRKRLGLDTKTKVAFETDGDRLIITKAFPTCVVCGGEEQLIKIKDKHICTDCAKLIK